MNLPNKITISRIVLSLLLMIGLLFPYELIGITLPSKLVFGVVKVEIKYVIGGIIFVIAALTDFIDGNIARKTKQVTDFGKVMDAIADKILVNGILIILAGADKISIAIPVVIITRDIFVDSIKMVAGSKGNTVGASIIGKIKTICMMIGITLVFFYNLPFELFNADVANALLFIACVLSVISGVQYYSANKKYLIER